MDPIPPRRVVCHCPECKGDAKISRSAAYAHRQAAIARELLSQAIENSAFVLQNETPSPWPQAVHESDPMQQVFQAGRSVISKVAASAQVLAGLELDYQNLRSADAFDPRLLSLLPFTDSFSSSDPLSALDESDAANFSYIHHATAISDLMRRVSDVASSVRNTFLGVEAEGLERKLKSLRSDHIAVVRQAAETRTARFRKSKEMRGRGVEVLETALLGHIKGGPLQSATRLFSGVLTSVLGLSSAATSVALTLNKSIVKLAFQVSQASSSSTLPFEAQSSTASPKDTSLLTPHLEDVLRHLPTEAESAAAGLQLASESVIYAACPKCSALYKPSAPVKGRDGRRPEGWKPYQERCTHMDLNGRTCDAPLLRARLNGSRLEWRAIRRYPFRSPILHIRDLLSRSEIEKALEHIPKEATSDVNDILESPMLQSLKTASGQTFVREIGHLSFAVGIDWFNPFTNLDAKKKWSIGAVYLVCLSLPAHLRYRLENVALVGIIPGPLEPSMEQINAFLQPLVEAFQRLYEPGIWLTETWLYPEGRLVKAVLALLIADLVGAKHVAGFASHRHTFFCHLCLLPISEINNITGPWPERNLTAHLQATNAWNSAGNQVERDRLTKASGIRYSVLSQLPYWNPFQQVPVDILHMTLSLFKKHARDVWHMNSSVFAGDSSFDRFYKEPDPLAGAEAEHVLRSGSTAELQRLTKALLQFLCHERGIPTGNKGKGKLVNALQGWRMSTGIVDESGKVRPEHQAQPFVPPSKEQLRRQEVELETGIIEQTERRVFCATIPPETAKSIGNDCKINALRALCYQRKIMTTGARSKEALVEKLLEWKAQTGQGYTPQSRQRSQNFFPAMGSELLALVRKDMERTITPGWMKLAPKNLGSVKHGKLSSKEWRTVFLVSFVITLIQQWGSDYSSESTTRTKKHDVLDNFLHLVVAITLCLQDRMSENIVKAYTIHMKAYLTTFKRLYPDQSFVNYHHNALHLPTFLRGYGPATPWGTGPYEVLNGMCQGIPTNSVFGDLELTIARRFWMASDLKALICTPTRMPPALHDIANVVSEKLDESTIGGMARTKDLSSDLSPGWKVVPEANGRAKIPDALRPLLLHLLDGFDNTLEFVLCHSVERNGMTFSTGERSSRDSQVSFRLHDGSIRCGRIYSIICDASVDLNQRVDTSRVIFCLDTYKELQTADQPKDHFSNHPIVGRAGYKLAKMVYDDFEECLNAISAGALIGHVGRCGVEDAEGKLFQQTPIITIQLDRSFLASQVTDALLETMAQGGIKEFDVPLGQGKRRREDAPEDAGPDEDDSGSLVRNIGAPTPQTSSNDQQSGTTGTAGPSLPKRKKRPSDKQNPSGRRDRHVFSTTNVSIPSSSAASSVTLASAFPSLTNESSVVPQANAPISSSVGGVGVFLKGPASAPGLHMGSSSFSAPLSTFPTRGQSVIALRLQGPTSSRLNIPIRDAFPSNLSAPQSSLAAYSNVGKQIDWQNMSLDRDLPPANSPAQRQQVSAPQGPIMPAAAGVKRRKIASNMYTVVGKPHKPLHIGPGSSAGMRPNAGGTDKDQNSKMDVD